jgi:hypothetical protein
MEAGPKMISQISGVERHIRLRETVRDKPGYSIQTPPYGRGELKCGKLTALPGPGILRSA